MLIVKEQLLQSESGDETASEIMQNLCKRKNRILRMEKSIHMKNAWSIQFMNF